MRSNIYPQAKGTERNTSKCTAQVAYVLYLKANISCKRQKSSSPLEQLVPISKPRPAQNLKHKTKTTHVQYAILKRFDLAVMKGNFFLLRNKLKAIDFRENVSNNRLEFQKEEIY